MPYFIEDQTTNAYNSRCLVRQTQLMQATMDFVQYFMNLGDDKPTADQKVSDVSTEVAIYLYAYVLGNKTPLLDMINASVLPFMDQTAKDFLIQQLS